MPSLSKLMRITQLFITGRNMKLATVLWKQIISQVGLGLLQTAHSSANAGYNINRLLSHRHRNHFINYSGTEFFLWISAI